MRTHARGARRVRQALLLGSVQLSAVLIARSNERAAAAVITCIHLVVADLVIRGFSGVSGGSPLLLGSSSAQSHEDSPS